MRRSAHLAALALLAACQREASEKPAAPVPMAVIDARPASIVAAPEQKPAAPEQKNAAPEQKNAALAPVFDPQDPLTVPSLEISGEVQLPPEASPPKRVFIYVSSGDCLDASAPLLRRMPITETGAFLAHIVAPPGTELSLCAAGEHVPGGPSSLYGKYGKPIRIAAQREQELREVQIKLAIAAPRQFPSPKK